MRLGRLWGRLLDGRPLARALDQRLGHAHQAHAVADRVMELQHERAAPALEVLDHRQLPERPREIEVPHRHRLREVEQRAQRAVAGRLVPAEVRGEIEVRIHLPARRRERQRIRQHALAQPRQRARGALDLALEPLPVGRAIHQPDHRDGRTQQRVALDVPHQGVAVAHAVFVADGVVGHGGSWHRRPWGAWRRRASIAPCDGLHSRSAGSPADCAGRGGRHMRTTALLLVALALATLAAPAEAGGKLRIKGKGVDESEIASGSSSRTRPEARVRSKSRRRPSERSPASSTASTPTAGWR